MGKIIKEKGFKQKASLKHVKTRTPYKVVDQYEKEFKYDFATMLGEAMDEYMHTMAKMLGVKKSALNKGETENKIIDVLNTETNCGVEGDCGHTHFEI